MPDGPYPFVCQNAWTNTIVIQFQDQFSNPANVVIPVGSTFHGITISGTIYVWDFFAFQYLTEIYGLFGYSDHTDYAGAFFSDGTTNGMYILATYYPQDLGLQDNYGRELYIMGGNQAQGPDVLYNLNFSQVREAGVDPYEFLYMGFGLGFTILFAQWKFRVVKHITD